MNKMKALCLAVVVGAMAGCSTNLPINYSPSSSMSASGAVTVSEFKYLPHINGEVARNEIKNTTPGAALFEQNIDILFRDAVFKEFRFVGINTAGQKHTVSGEIQEFLIDDLGFKVDWTIRVKYVVTDDGVVKYEAVKETKRLGTNKFANVFGAINENIKLNIEDLLKDPKFLEAIR